MEPDDLVRSSDRVRRALEAVNDRSTFFDFARALAEYRLQLDAWEAEHRRTPRFALSWPNRTLSAYLGALHEVCERHAESLVFPPTADWRAFANALFGAMFDEGYD